MVFNSDGDAMGLAMFDTWYGHGLLKYCIDFVDTIFGAVLNFTQAEPSASDPNLTVKLRYM